MKRVRVVLQQKNGSQTIINIPADYFVICEDGFVYVYSGEECVAMAQKEVVEAIYTTQEGQK